MNVKAISIYSGYAGPTPTSIDPMEHISPKIIVIEIHLRRTDCYQRLIRLSSSADGALGRLTISPVYGLLPRIAPESGAQIPCMVVILFAKLIDEKWSRTKMPNVNQLNC